MKSIQRAWVRSWRLVRDEGLRAYLGRVFAKLSQILLARGEQAHLMVDATAAQSVDWTVPSLWADNQLRVASGPIDIAWIMSPPGRESGGHQNLFRFLRFAETAGHRCTIYLYSSLPTPISIRDIRGLLRESQAYPDFDAEIRIYDPAVGVDPATQALFATGWETAYPAYMDGSSARRFYFVQDFEPSFYELGTQAILAENSYRFGFHGITAGGWLRHKLSTEYGMTCDSFDFSVNRSNYTLTNREPRTEVFFYARPVTARRAFELGVMTLEKFAKMRPDVTINLAGWDVSPWNVPFAHRNLASLQLDELNAVYNRCAAGLVLSLTNMSLLPLELISSGVTPVVNDGPNNRMVSENPYIEYVPPVPAALARRMAEVVGRTDAVERSIAMSESVSTMSWDDSGTQFVQALERAMRG